MKKILFLTRLFSPHVGGVETHVLRVSQELQKKGYQIVIITEQYEDALNEYEMVNGLEIHRIPIVSTKSKTALWSWIWQHRSVFQDTDVVHVHDVFWWLIPVISIVRKKFYMTFHGWEGTFPPKKSAILQRRTAAGLAKGVIQVGEYIETWYGTKPTMITYGGVDQQKDNQQKVKNVFKKMMSAAKQGSFITKERLQYEAVFVGRLSTDNDIQKVIQLFTLLKEKHPKAKFAFVGDGPYRALCEEVGVVTGFVSNVSEYIHDSSIVCANSYLSMMEAQLIGKLVIAMYSNPLKEEYLKSYPQSDHMIIAEKPDQILEQLMELRSLPPKLRQMVASAQRWAREQSWSKVANTYEELWER